VHGVVGVVQDVEEYLLQLVGVAHDIRQYLVEVFDDFHAMTVEVIRAQLDGAAQDRFELHGLLLRRHLAGKAEQVLQICLVRCASCRMTRRSFRRRLWNLRILHEQVGKPRIAVSGLFTS